MDRLRTSIVASLALLASSLLLSGCSTQTRLTDQEMAKIQPQLQRLLAGERVADLEELSSLRTDGSREYPLIVRMTNAQELDSIGVTPGSRFGEIVTVRVTTDEIRRIARLPSVTSIEAGARSEPNSTVH